MSAEVETKDKDAETPKEPPKKDLKERVKEQWQLGFKILELIICAICMGLAYEPILGELQNSYLPNIRKMPLHHIGIMYTAFTGFMLINVMFIISRAIGDRIPYKTTSLFAVSGSALFLVAAILLIIYKPYVKSVPPHAYLATMLTTSIVFAFFNVLAFIVDGVLTFIKQEDF